ncbi:MAG: hypothetical protein AMXMBFR4_12780 [Candidatus Hydrogenedentota bacterium]
MKGYITMRTAFALAVLALAGAAIPRTEANPADFTLKEAGGDKSITLSEAKGRYVALHFLLKTECPICLKHTQTYHARGASVPGVEHVFIKPDEESDTLKWAAGLSPEDKANAPVIYRDPDARLADEFGIPNGYEFHGEVVHYPAFVLIGPDGNEVFRHVGKSTADRFSFDKFAAKMEELRTPPSVKQYNLDKSGLALQGYDPVSYYKGKPVKGLSNLATKSGGVVYQFANELNREEFLADPKRHMPAYGGWCATAMVEGKKVEIDPQNYKMTDGRLFLFYKGLIVNALGDWNKNEPQNIAKADDHWKRIAGE